MLLSLFAAFASASSNGPGEGWVALPLPALCAPAERGSLMPALWDANHLRSGSGGTEEVGRESTRAPRLALSTVVQMLEEDARAHSRALELFRGTPLLFARGDAQAIDGARALLLDLDQAARALAIELEVEVTAKGADDPARAARESFHARGRVLSGDEAAFGERETKSYLATFDIEVAADSGVSRPVMGSVCTGSMLHVRAARIEQGGRIHLSGLLDLCEQAELGHFEPGSDDLGKIIEQPKLQTVQIAFAGVVQSGKALEFSLHGAPLAVREWNVSIRASTRAGVDSASKDGWEMLDLALCAWAAAPLAPFGPGALAVSPTGVFVEDTPTNAISPSAFAARLEQGRNAAASSSSSNNVQRAHGGLFWSDSLLFVPRGESALLNEARAMLLGAERLRSNSNVLELGEGAFSATLPVCVGFPARIIAGTEQTWLIGYRTELAPQTWMPVPEVRSAFDGLAMNFAPAESSVSYGAWQSRTSAVRLFAREEARLGRLQAPERKLRSCSGRLWNDEPPRECLSEASGAGAFPLLTIAWHKP